MIRSGFWVIVVCIAFAEAGAQSILPALIDSQSVGNADRIEGKVNNFIQDLDRKRANRNDQDFLRLVFHEAHKKFFKTYKQYAQFPEVFEKGRYDCLSATSLLAVVFHAFGYEFDLIETNYHIFISVQTSTGVILIESTDRLNGFVTNPSEIDVRISTYKANQLQADNTNRIQYRFDLNLYNIIKPSQLSGLLLFNQAVVEFNNQQYELCALRLREAVQIYDSPRTSEFAAILITAISTDASLTDETKRELIRPFVKYIRGNATIAAR
jgi:hypothetical protein